MAGPISWSKVSWDTTCHLSPWPGPATCLYTVVTSGTEYGAPDPSITTVRGPSSSWTPASLEAGDDPARTQAGARHARALTSASSWSENCRGCLIPLSSCWTLSSISPGATNMDSLSSAALGLTSLVTGLASDVVFILRSSCTLVTSLAASSPATSTWSWYWVGCLVCR